MKTNEKNKDQLISELKNRLIAMQMVNAELGSQLAKHRQVRKDSRKAEKGLELSEEKFRPMFENSDALVLHVDRDGLVINANEKIEELTGHPRNEIVGKHFAHFDVFKPDASQSILQLFREAVEHNTKFSGEVELVYPNGDTRIIEPNANLIKRSGQVESVLVLMKDITERKKSEEKLAKLYTQERELRQHIEIEMKRRVDFTRTVAHELKTPLTPVLASIDSLLSELHDDRLLGLANNISRGAASLDNRINELLDLARGEIGILEFNPEPVDLLQILRETIETITPLAINCGQSLKLDVPNALPLVQADASRIQQVLLNLLNNAIKFTPQDGTIKLKVRENDGSVIIEIQDTGRGMSKKQQERAFEPYRRLLNDKDHSDGLGLGLALCKTLVELHGGKIWGRSRAGKGSTFAFSLPINGTIQNTTRPVTVNKLWKVLMIEDDHEIVNSVSLALQKDWPEVELLSARFGEDGLSIVETEKISVVLLDLGLPDTDGFEVLRSIRLFSAVPIIVLSVRQEEADVTKAFELGANDYIAKPYRKMELISRLKVQLRAQIHADESTPIICGSLCLDPSTHQLTFGEKEISLTVVEGRIMQELMKNAGHITTYSRLTEAVWGGDCDDCIENIDTLRVYIRYLRRKLETNPSKPRLILTKSGVGYSLSKPV